MGLGQLRGPSWLTGTPRNCPNQISIVAHDGSQVNGFRMGNSPQGLKPAFLLAANGTAEEAAEELSIRRPAPQGAIDFGGLAVSLKRYPDTKPSLPAACEAVPFPKLSMGPVLTGTIFPAGRLSPRGLFLWRPWREFCRRRWLAWDRRGA